MTEKEAYYEVMEYMRSLDRSELRGAKSDGLLQIFRAGDSSPVVSGRTCVEFLQSLRDAQARGELP